MTARRIFLSELTFWVVVCIMSLYLIYPLRKSLRFGSDLVGGTYLTLQVHTQDAVDTELVTKMQEIESKLKSANMALPVNKSIEKGAIQLTFNSVQDVQQASLFIKDQKTTLEQKVEGSVIFLSFPERVVNEIKKEAVERNIDVLRTRLDKFSVAEIPISASGDKNIIIELPDVADPLQAKAMIGKAAQLEFRLVEKFGMTKDDILYELDGSVPSDREVLPGKSAQEGFYLVTKYTDITGKSLKDARPGFGGQSQNEPVVQFKFNEEGAQRFYEITSKNYGKQLAIVLDGIVISAPRINEPIRGEGNISGNFTAESARELAMLLKSGSFVAKVSFEEERQIGPALGAEARHSGLMSCLVGLALLFLFSIYYYSLSGLFAFLALVYNMLLILVGMSWLGATLTLPGIAGMVLTVGMAIDASVLIFERIKEELLTGVSIQKAVEVGFSDAMSVILDGNITTFVIGIVLYSFGTGPIKGFAVTMMLGIVATLITGLFFLRSLFKFVLDNFRVQKLKI